MVGCGVVDIIINNNNNNNNNNNCDLGLQIWSSFSKSKRVIFCCDGPLLLFSGGSNVGDAFFMNFVCMLQPVCPTLFFFVTTDYSELLQLFAAFRHVRKLANIDS